MKTSHPIDIAIGRRIMALRLARDMSRATLGHAVNVSFQQIQKYEQALNRVSISMLWEIAQALETTVDNLTSTLPTDFKNSKLDLADEFLSSYGAIELINSFLCIPTTHDRRVVLDVSAALASLSPTIQSSIPAMHK